MNALDAEFDTIPLWAKHLQNVIERSHRSDDEEFLCPRGHLFTSKEAFIKECYGCNYYRNIERVHHWIKMGCTQGCLFLNKIQIFFKKFVYI